MRLAPALPILFALLASACSDVVAPTASAPAPARDGYRAELRCTASVRAGVLRCGEEGAAAGPARTLIIGGQNVYVRLTGFNIAYTPADSVFTMDVVIENLMTQAFGTPDEETDTGLRVFFETGPTTTAGSGQVAVDNEDGEAFFLAPDQPYFDYAGMLYTDAATEPRTWHFKVDPEVETFVFTVYVQGQMHHEPSLLRFRRFFLNQSAWYNGIWGVSTDQLFVVGFAGALARRAGGGWIEDESPTFEHLWDVWGSSATDVFAVGEAGTIVHWDGTAWDTMTSGLECSCQGLYGVWGSGATDVWAVGDGGVIAHYDGVEWTLGDTMDVAWLSGVWGSGPSDVFVAGDSGAVFHYDGAAWNPMVTGIENIEVYINTLWGLSGTDVYAAWSEGVLHYDGTSWSPLPGLPTCEHYSVWGTAADNLFVADGCGIQHWDGSTWAYMDPGGGVTELWGTGPLSLLTNADGYVFRGTR
jgi:hypothetical protein